MKNSKLNKAVDPSISTIITEGLKVNIIIPGATLAAIGFTTIITTALILIMLTAYNNNK